MFNNNLNEDFKQYRCIALKNNSSSETAYNVSAFFRFNSRNSGSKFRIAVETPRNDFISGTTQSGSLNTFIDSSLSTYENNALAGASVLFETLDSNNGSVRTILSFDSATATAVLDAPLPVAIVNGATYFVSPGPIQRVSSGLIEPDLSSERTSSFSEASVGDPLSIRPNGDNNNLGPGDVAFIWIERELFRTANALTNNSFTIGLNYELE